MYIATALVNKMCRIRIPLVLLLVTYIGCFASLVYYKEGSTVNLDFRRKNNPSVFPFSIYKNQSAVCYSFDGYTTTITDDWKKNLLNCTITAEFMSIIIANLTSEKTGLFYLHPSIQAGNSSLDTITLEIARPVTSVTLFPTKITVFAGEQLNLTCTSSYCIPSANITWYWSSTVMTIQPTSKTNKNGSLLITTSSISKTVDKMDNGNIVYCTASNIQDENVFSTKPSVNVLYKPEVKSSAPNPYTVKEGETANLICTLIDANPSNITWQWFKNDTVIDAMEDRDTYAIPNITRSRSGLYKCTASNNAGTSEPATIFVDVQYKPEVTTETLTYKVTEGGTASLQCRVSHANPKTNINWIWYKANRPSSILQTEKTYVMTMIQRNKSGPYICSAKNSVGFSKGVTIFVDVQYKPEVTTNTPSPYTVEEGQRVELKCIVSAANPNTSITWKWFNTNNSSNSLSNTSTYALSNIQRGKSGTYSCNATNSVGTSAVILVVNVQYIPAIEEKPSLVVNESEKVILTRAINSNPLSNVYWFKGTKPLKNQTLVSNASYAIENATCTDTSNYTLKASNGIGNIVTSRVELIVNCKPMIDKTNITLGVTDASGIDFSISILAYPEPQYVMEYENGSRNIQMMDTVVQNTVNNFTINFNQTFVKQSDYGTFYLRVSNSFGETTAVVNIIAQRRPDSPKNIEIFCGVLSAKVQWKSSFNGGDPQSFTAIALSAQHEASRSDPKPDNGESLIHYVYVQNLKPSVTYQFYIVAQNSHGNITSDKKSCTTLQKDTQINVPLIAGGAVGGGIALAIVVIIAFVLLRRFTTFGKQKAGKSQRFENEVVKREDADDDGMRDNILYVSAGPNVDEQPEVTIYAAVNKKAPESNNNANVYAEVNRSRQVSGKGALCSDVKPKRGLFKKDANRTKDGNPKQKKGKKKNSKQDVADVYENSEDIAMSSKSDNVYSNTGQKVQNKEERGYKNKDGLLYVEVQFDGKTEKGNQTIHGEDEKTDYATVEFPMAASKDAKSGNEKM